MTESGLQNHSSPEARHAVRAEIHRFIDDAQPGWGECLLRDSSGVEWLIKDKLPTFTDAPLNADSIYPQPGVIRCQIVREWLDDDGRLRCIINTSVPDAVEAAGGETQFEVFREQIHEH